MGVWIAGLDGMVAELPTNAGESEASELLRATDVLPIVLVARVGDSVIEALFGIVEASGSFVNTGTCPNCVPVLFMDDNPVDIDDPPFGVVEDVTDSVFDALCKLTKVNDVVDDVVDSAVDDDTDSDVDDDVRIAVSLYDRATLR